MPAAPSQRRPGQRSRVSYQLILIDGEPVRKKTRREYEKAKRELEKARRQLEQFETEDLPAYPWWMRGTFGAQLTSLRDLARQLQEKEWLIDDVQRTAFQAGMSLPRAYRLVLHLRAHPEDAPPQEEDAAGVDQEAGNASPQNDFPPEDEATRHSAFAEFARAFEDFTGHELPPGMFPPGVAPKPSSQKRVKELYRILARKLHPDAQEQMTAQKLEWWHEVQEAYEEGDRERMEMILSLIEMQEDASPRHTSVSMLQRIIARVRVSVREVKRKISRHRSEPSWDFVRRPDHTALGRRIRAELDEEITRLEQEIADADQLLGQWAKKAASLSSHTPRRPGRRPNRPADQAKFPFEP